MRKGIPTEVSSWSLKKYCDKHDLELKTLDDVAQYLTRMIRDYGFQKARKNRLIPIAAKGKYAYAFSSEYATLNLDGILERDPEPKFCYSESDLGIADSVQIWMKHGTRKDEVAHIETGHLDRDLYIVLDNYSIYFDLPAEQIAYFAVFLEDHRRLDSLLGIQHWEPCQLAGFPAEAFGPN